MDKDDDIVAVKFELSGRHPTFDICDMYAKADMYNLGAGVYPKDKLPPLPVHPHCLCRYSEIYTGEVDTEKAKPRIRESGDKWLNGLTEYQRQKVLGVDGLKAWKAGRDWRKYMHGYAGFEEAKTRLTRATKAAQNTSRETKRKEVVEQKEYVVRESEREKVFLQHDLKNGIIKKEKSLIKGVPLSIGEVTAKKGGKTWDFYDANGDEYLQVSNNDHGQKKESTFGEHGEHCHWYYREAGKKHSTHGGAEEIPQFICEAMKGLL